MGGFCVAQGAQLSSLRRPRGVGLGGREALEGGDICAHRADSGVCIAETQHCKAMMLQ